MAVTQNTYTGNGSTVLYSFTFPYLETTDIKVSVNGTVVTTYTFANATTIQFNTAPANGAAIRIYRQTDDSALPATFYSGSAIRSADLNDNFTQNLYVTQESTNNAATATTTANTALSNSSTALSQSNTAIADSATALSQSNTAISDSATALSQSNTAISDSASAVSTANSAASDASTALSQSNTAISDSATALSQSNTAIADSATAVSDSATALSTANTALSTANTALSTANTADANANAALNAIAGTVQYALVANVAAIPGSPANGDAIEIADSTGIESFTPLTNIPAGYVGDTGLSVRLQYLSSGSTWNWLNYFPNNSETRYLKLAGGSVTGNLEIGAAGSLTFEGSTANTFETTLAVVDPTADRTITLPNVTGTVVTTGDTGTVTSTMIADGTIVDGDVNASAAIAGTKISPDFGSQNVTTTGTATAAALIPSGSSVPTNGVYLPSANNVAISTNGTGRLFVGASGNVGIGVSNPSEKLQLADGNIYLGTGDRIIYNGGASGNLTLQTGTLGNILFNTQAGSERLRITSDGKLGLGTSTVDELLHLKGGSAASTTVKVESTATASERSSIHFFNGSVSRGRVGGSNDFDGLTLDSSTTESAAAIRFRTGGTSLTTKMTLTSGGSLGIGTTTVSHTLEVRPSANDGNLFVGNASGPGLQAGYSTGETSSYIQAYNTTSSAFVDLNINASTLRFGSGSAATERARIDSSGRLLVGTSTTSGVAKLQVQGYVGDDSGLGLLALRLGNSSPASGANLGRIDFNDSTDSRGASIGAERDGGTWGASSKPSRLVFSTTADGASSPTERMRIRNDGKVLIGTTTVGFGSQNGFTIEPDSASYITASHPNGAASGSDYLVFGYNGSKIGSITQNGTTGVAYNTSSDYRLKENIAPLVGAIDRLIQIPVHRFNFISEPGKTVDGFLAHEAQAVVPECVTGTKDEVDADGNPVYQGIDQSKLVPLLTAALQEALAEIESLKARVTALEP